MIHTAALDDMNTHTVVYIEVIPQTPFCCHKHSEEHQMWINPQIIQQKHQVWVMFAEHYSAQLFRVII